MELPVRFTRIYALSQTQTVTPNSHPASPIQLPDFPQRALRTEIHVGSVPDQVLQALKCHRAWIGHALRGGIRSANELRCLAKEIPDKNVLSDERNLIRAKAGRYWYVTLIIEDMVELPEDTTQKLLGIAHRPWIDLDDPTFLSRHTDALNELSVKVAISIAPYRYQWCAWDGPLVQFPTGVDLRPPMYRAGRVRVFTAPPLERTDLSGLQSTAANTAFQSDPMTVHFYLRATCGADPIARFFDAFRALERLCGTLNDSLLSAAKANSTSGAAERRKAVRAFQASRPTLRKRFATMAIAFNPTGADVDLEKFDELYKWRNDLAHGNSKLQPDDAPDEETFELLHRYLAMENGLMANGMT